MPEEHPVVKNGPGYMLLQTSLNSGKRSPSCRRGFPCVETAVVGAAVKETPRLYGYSHIIFFSAIVTEKTEALIVVVHFAHYFELSKM
jgi:hypothetical protein